MTRSRLTVSFFIFALLIGATGMVPVAHAVTPTNQTNTTTFVDSDSSTGVGQTSSTIDTSAVNNQVTAATPASVQAPSSVTGASTGSAAPSTPTTGSADTNPFDIVMTYIMELFAWLLGIAAITLDNAMYYTVVHMGGFVNGLSAVGVAWRILRDIGNIILIFGFVALGITVILDVGWYGGGTKMLPTLLIAAVFLNFSLFIAEAVIDTGNLFATEFYTQINNGQTAAPISYSNAANEGISLAVMNQLGFQTIYEGALTPNNAVFKSGNVFLLSFMAILLFMVAAFVFFSLSFILIARFIFLIFLIIVAPIGFAGLAVPKLDKIASQWWSSLFAQTITAPVMLLMLYVALAVITDSSFLSGFTGSTQGSSTASSLAASAWTGWLGNPTQLGNLASAILSFIVAMGLLLAVTMLAKKMGAVGGGWATKMGGAITGGIVGYGFIGGTSLAGRIGLGGTGRLLNNKKIQAGADQGGLKGLGFKALAFTGRSLENRTYDLRNVKTIGSVAGAVGGALGSGGSGFDHVDLGHGATVTAKTAIDSTQEAYKKYKPFSGDWWRDQQKVYEKAASEVNRKDVFKAGVTPDIKKEFKKMSDDEITELKGIRNGLDNFVKALSPATYGNLQKSPKLLAGEKAKLKATWDAQFATVPDATATMGRFSTEEIATLDGATLTNPNVISTLKTTELDAVRRKQSLTKDQRHTIYAHMMATPALTPDFNAYLASDPTGGRRNYWNV